MTESDMLRNAKSEIDSSVDTNTPIYASLTYGLSNEERKDFIEHSILSSFTNFMGIQRNIIINRRSLNDFIDLNKDREVVSEGEVMFIMDGVAMKMFIEWSRGDHPRECLRFDIV